MSVWLLETKHDNLKRTGAELLVRTIKHYWWLRGKSVNVWVQPVDVFGHTVYAIKSDMVNGWPRE